MPHPDRNPGNPQEHEIWRPSRRDLLRLVGVGLLGLVAEACSRTVPEPLRTKAVIPPGYQKVGPDQQVVAKASTTPPPDLAQEAKAFVDAWPKTADAAVQRWGGKASLWNLDQRVLNGTNSRIEDYMGKGASYTMYEWRYLKGNTPFPWPKTPEEALKYFLGDHIPAGVSAKNMFPQNFVVAGRNLLTGWHFSEDFHGDVQVKVHGGEVLEGYTANKTQRSQDDRAYIIYGGDQTGTVSSFNLGKVQGFTVWQPGTDPNGLALRMDSYEGNSVDHPHYLGPNAQRLGPDPIGFPPSYPAPGHI